MMKIEKKRESEAEPRRVPNNEILERQSKEQSKCDRVNSEIGDNQDHVLSWNPREGSVPRGMQ